MCWLLFSGRSTPMLPQWHIKDPGHSAKSAGGRLHLNMHTPLTQQSWIWLTMLLSRHSVGTYPETSLHATCQGVFSHSRLSSLSHYGLILALREELVCASLSRLKKKNAGREWMVQHSPKILTREEKATTTITFSDLDHISRSQECHTVLAENFISYLIKL